MEPVEQGDEHLELKTARLGCGLLPAGKVGEPKEFRDVPVSSGPGAAALGRL